MAFANSVMLQSNGLTDWQAECDEAASLKQHLTVAGSPWLVLLQGENSKLPFRRMAGAVKTLWKWSEIQSFC